MKKILLKSVSTHLSADRVGLSLLHFHQQAVPSRLRNLCYSQTWRTHPAGTASRLAINTCFLLLFVTFSLSNGRLFLCLIFSHKGERKERGSRGVRFKQQQLTAHRRCQVAMSHSLTHAYTHKQSEDAKQQNTHMKTVKCTESPLTAGAIEAL